MSETQPNSAETVDDHWEIYVTYVDDQPAVILVDIGVSPAVPLPGLSKLVWFWVHLKSPDEQGFPTDDEDQVLNDIEDLVTEEMDEIESRFVGRISTDGRREFYFYVKETGQFYERVSKAMQSKPDYEFEMDETDDEQWRHYQDVLYPAPEDFQQIQNQNLIARLHDEGDSLTKIRPVDHFANFKTEQDCEAFIAEAKGLGYETVSRPLRTDNSEFLHSAGLLREHAIDEETIDHITFELFELAHKHGGEYEGWVSKVVK